MQIVLNKTCTVDAVEQAWHEDGTSPNRCWNWSAKAAMKSWYRSSGVRPPKSASRSHPKSPKQASYGGLTCLDSTLELSRISPFVRSCTRLEQAAFRTTTPGKPRLNAWHISCQQ